MELYRRIYAAAAQEKRRIGIAGFLQTMPIFFPEIKSLSCTTFSRGRYFFMVTNIKNISVKNNKYSVTIATTSFPDC